MADVSLELDGKGQYLGQIESTTTFEVYNAGIYNHGIYNFPVNIEIGNIWTLGFWVKPKPFKEFGTIFSVGEIDKKNTILISTTPVSSTAASLSELRVLINGKEFTIQDVEVEFDYRKHLPQLRNELADIRSEIAGLETEETRLVNKISAVETARDS